MNLSTSVIAGVWVFSGAWAYVMWNRDSRRVNDSTTRVARESTSLWVSHLLAGHRTVLAEMASQGYVRNQNSRTAGGRGHLSAVTCPPC